MLMPLVGYLSARSVMRQHLADNAANTLQTLEANVAEELARSDLMILNTFHTVRGMLDRGASKNSLLYRLQGITNWIRRSELGVPSLEGVYGYFFDDIIDGIGLIPTENFFEGISQGLPVFTDMHDPMERPWYKVAQGLPNGQIAYTDPYKDARTGKLLVTAVQNVYGMSGVYYGILALDIDIAWFNAHAHALDQNTGAYRIILNQNMKVISHPQEEKLGLSLEELGDGYATIAADLQPGGTFRRARRIADTNGETVIAFFKRMDNGWYGALITPRKNYSHDLNTIAMNPAFLGLILILVFSLIMIRIIGARIRTEEINIDTSNAKTQLEKTVSERTAELEERTRELEIQSHLAKEASEAKGSFLARMSHEIRTPLNAIIGMTEIARNSTSIEKKDYSLTEIASASDHLLGILNDVLDMSKIENGKFTLVNEPFVLDTAMQEVAHIILQRCREKHIFFEPDFSLLSDITVMGDKLRLKQVLINLLGNAVKFTRENGMVRFVAEIAGWDEKQIDVHFLVSDNGIGMQQEQIEKLFHPFEQTDSSIAARFGGTGLGLSISQNLVQLMGGLITVESEFDKGSTFEFTLKMDVAEQLAETSAPKDIPEQQDFTGKRILLAEDIDINLFIVKELLADTHIKFEEAVDGVQCLEKFSASPEHYYDLIFMDILMPNMNGHEAARRIRALNREDAKTIPIIAMTANAYREDIDLALRAGMNAHLAKPINVKEVKKALSRWLK
jgi:signal transduction histidine kinase/CheY-like chemotaxis protein